MSFGVSGSRPFRDVLTGVEKENEPREAPRPTPMREGPGPAGNDTAPLDLESYRTPVGAELLLPQVGRLYRMRLPFATRWVEPEIRFSSDAVERLVALEHRLDTTTGELVRKNGSRRSICSFEKRGVRMAFCGPHTVRCGANGFETWPAPGGHVDADAPYFMRNVPPLSHLGEAAFQPAGPSGLLSCSPVPHSLVTAGDEQTLTDLSNAFARICGRALAQFHERRDEMKRYASDCRELERQLATELRRVDREGDSAASTARIASLMEQARVLLHDPTLVDPERAHHVLETDWLQVGAALLGIRMHAVPHGKYWTSIDEAHNFRHPRGRDRGTVLAVVHSRPGSPMTGFVPTELVGHSLRRTVEHELGHVLFALLPPEQKAAVRSLELRMIAEGVPAPSVYALYEEDELISTGMELRTGGGGELGQEFMRRHHGELLSIVDPYLSNADPLPSSVMRWG